MNVITDEIHAATLKELAAANEIHPLFASLHEGFAVAREEMEECADELRMIDRYMGEMWGHIKEDMQSHAEEAARIIMHHSEQLAAEACQLAAMMQKIMYSEEARK